MADDEEEDLLQPYFMRWGDIFSPTAVFPQSMQPATGGNTISSHQQQGDPDVQPAVASSGSAQPQPVHPGPAVLFTPIPALPAPATNFQTTGVQVTSDVQTPTVQDRVTLETPSLQHYLQLQNRLDHMKTHVCALTSVLADAAEKNHALLDAHCRYADRMHRLIQEERERAVNWQMACETKQQEIEDLKQQLSQRRR